jgi:hypothetical protein
MITEHAALTKFELMVLNSTGVTIKAIAQPIYDIGQSAFYYSIPTEPNNGRNTNWILFAMLTLEDFSKITTDEAAQYLFDRYMLKLL